jgi:hypothetical protein
MVERRRTDAMLATYIRSLGRSLLLTQNANDVLRREQYLKLPLFYMHALPFGSRYVHPQGGTRLPPTSKSGGTTRSSPSR